MSRHIDALLRGTLIFGFGFLICLVLALVWVGAEAFGILLPVFIAFLVVGVYVIGRLSEPYGP